MEEKKRRRASFALSTWRRSAAFHRGLEALEAVLPLAEARAYLLSGARRADVDPQVYADIGALQALRRAGIQAEMRYAEAQLRRYLRAHPERGETPADLVGAAVLSGDDLRYGFSAELYDAAPSLQVYEQFLWTTVRELEMLRGPP
ncbi:MAG: hypothetical protein HFF17_05305 [Oscillospiraceae bacterium]|nr:hypothetical protein [Oscillospiraceae bacterium]